MNLICMNKFKVGDLVYWKELTTSNKITISKIGILIRKYDVKDEDIISILDCNKKIKGWYILCNNKIIWFRQNHLIKLN